MIPYNFKVWATPAELMNYVWIGERVSVVNVEAILRNVLLREDQRSWGPNNTFKYPLKGGTGFLHWSGSHTVGVGVDRPANSTKNWLYFPEPEVPFYRVTYLSNYSPYITPEPDQTLFLTRRRGPATSRRMRPPSSSGSWTVW